MNPVWDSTVWCDQQELQHAEAPTDSVAGAFSYLLSVTQTSYRRDGTGYRSASLPPRGVPILERGDEETVRDVETESLENLPTEMDRSSRSSSIDGEGLPGVLREQGGSWWYNIFKFGEPKRRGSRVGDAAKVRRFTDASAPAFGGIVGTADARSCLTYQAAATWRWSTSNIHRRVLRAHGRRRLEAVSSVSFPSPLSTGKIRT